jgi:tRNA pseudouridine13 synthase
MQPGSIEQSVGITTYLTPYPGIHGTLRTIPEDFFVQELPTIPHPDEKGKHTIAWVQSTNWDTHLLVKKISRRLEISSKRIGFAGTKDKRAVSTQLMSFYNISKEQLTTLTIKDVTITPLHTTKKPINLGQLQGNQFKIIIRTIDQKNTNTHLSQYIDYFTKNPGFPNYFGIQRFGGIRPITHLVGKHIIHGEFEKAVMIYLAQNYPEESPDIAEKRQQLAKTHDFTEALKTFPIHLRFERAMLSALQQHPDNFQNALLALPKKLLLMFINAYQSYLFNKILSKRLQNHLPLNHALPGDIIISDKNTGEKNQYITTTTANIEKVNQQIQKNHAVVSGILLGHTPVYASGEMGEIEHNVIEEEHLDPRLFFIPEIPFLSSSGIRRGIYAPVNNLNTSLTQDSITPKKNALELSFDLQKGCYATSFLREWMKSTDVKKY